MPVISGGKIIEGSVYRGGGQLVAATGAPVAPPQLLTGAGAAGTTFDTIAAKGALYVDTTAGKLYINTGTLASNTWTVVGDQTA